VSDRLVVHGLHAGHEAGWTAFVQAHPAATLYHSLAWRDFLVDVFGHRPEYLIAEEDGRTRGVLPLFEVRLPGFGTKLISLPYDLGSGGALAAASAVERALVRRAIDLARERRVGYLELRYGDPRPALEPLELARSEPVLLSEMALDDEAAVQQRISADHRKAVRKAALRGVVVRPAETKRDYLAFYDVYLRVFRHFGTPPYGPRYFTRLWERFHDTGRVQVFLAETSGRCLGGLVLFSWQRHLVSKFAACLPEAVPLRAYAALYARAIEHGLASGARRLSWGTSSRAQTGLVEFKERWGATTRPVVLYGLSVRQRIPDVASYYDSNGLARQVWRRLPLSWTRVGGAILNRWYC
jgi:FemAB-related protein (PEP-CTERM system-associated)